MPSLNFFGGDTRRHSRHSSNPQKPASHAPAVKPPASSTASKKRSNASKAPLRPSNRQDEKSTHTSGLQKNPPIEAPRKSSDMEDVDVFAYMDDEEEGSHHQTEDEHEEDDTADDQGLNTTASSPISAHHPSSHYSDLEVNAEQQSKRQTWHGGFDHTGSFHSDSGISMGSGSGDGGSPILQTKYPSIRRTSRFGSNGHEPSIPEHCGFYVPSEALSLQYIPRGADAWPQWEAAGNDNPEAYYGTTAHDVPPTITTSACQLSVTPPELSPQLPRGRKAQPPKEASRKKRGYTQLASTVSSQDDAVLMPVYRKFETLNNRILSYLQEEIMELEASLEELDAVITSEERSQKDAGRAASRRFGAKHPMQLYQRRSELMERCATKVNTYNQALSSYSNLTRTLSPSSHADINAYRKWMTKHKSVAEPEALFVQHRQDLVTVGRTQQHSALSNLEYSPFTMALTVLIHIVVFKFVPQLLARLVMSAVMGMALMCMASPASMLNLHMLKEKRRGLGLYAAVMFMLALVVD
ncbi:MAG: hypothetical protein Q9218_005707 [Villophora microphyllina]